MHVVSSTAFLLLFWSVCAYASGPVAPQGWEGPSSGVLPNGQPCCLPADLDGSGQTGGAFMFISTNQAEFGLFALTYSSTLEQRWQLLEKHPVASLESF